MNILIIEDSVTQLEFLKITSLLAFPDANIIDILDLDKGLRVAETLTPKDVVLLDLMYDKYTPEQTIEKFTDIMHRLPVIVVTGMKDDHYGELAKAAGANSYLQKPVTKELLRVHITQALQEEVIKVVSKITDKTVSKMQNVINDTTSQFGDMLFSMPLGPVILKSIPVVVINLLDDKMTIIYASTLLKDLFGYKVGELIGRPIDVLLPPDLIEKHHQHFKKYQKNPTTRSMNDGIWVDARKKDGSTFKAQVSLYTQKVGPDLMVFALVSDVTNAYNQLAAQPKTIL